MYILLGSGKPQWKIFRHNGPMFPPEYVPHKTPIIFRGEEFILPSLAEEYATLYAKYINTDYVNKPKFNKNFFNDFKKVLPDNLRKSSIEDFDFSLIKNYIENENQKKKDMSKDEKDKIKLKNIELEEPYKYCVIDGSKETVGNFKLEPPGIFLGRGEHPKIGSIKKRIKPEDITLNLDKTAPIPKINVPGEWGNIINDDSVIWLATWKDEITDKNKYIFTSMDSIFKSKSDESKFNLAKKLKRKVNSIRNSYEEKLNSEDEKTRQLSTALYFIDKFALRVGGKKDKKEEADTVGVTSLRVEHITLIPPNVVKLDFLAKDSVRYCKKVKVPKPIYDNLENFIRNKNNKDQLFNMISASSMNDFLETYMKNLTAKVFRTYNASFLFQKELDKINEDKVMSIHESERINYLINLFHQANTEVALLCNHQKSLTGDIENQVEKINKKLKELKKKRDKYKDKKDKERLLKTESKIKLLKLKKNNKINQKTVSLSTSKNNYIDPRIVYAFIKKFDIPEDKILSQTESKKFNWANSVEKDYRF